MKRTALLLCVLAAAAAGCGGDDEPATVTATQTVTTTVATTAAAPATSTANEDCSEVAGVPTRGGRPTPEACEVALLVARLYQAGARGEAMLCAQLVPSTAAQQRACSDFVAATERSGSPLEALEFTDNEASVDAHYRDDLTVRRFYVVFPGGDRRVDLVRSLRQQ